MLIFHVVKQGIAWNVATFEPGKPPLSSNEKPQAVAWACALAREHGGEAHVHDAIGRLETVYSYRDGIERQSLYASSRALLRQQTGANVPSSPRASNRTR